MTDRSGSVFTERADTTYCVPTKVLGLLTTLVDCVTLSCVDQLQESKLIMGAVRIRALHTIPVTGVRTDLEGDKTP
jgi:hypothetical protein